MKTSSGIIAQQWSLACMLVAALLGPIPFITNAYGQEAVEGSDVAVPAVRLRSMNRFPAKRPIVPTELNPVLQLVQKEIDKIGFVPGQDWSVGNVQFGRPGILARTATYGYKMSVPMWLWDDIESSTPVLFSSGQAMIDFDRTSPTPLLEITMTETSGVTRIWEQEISAGTFGLESIGTVTVINNTAAAGTYNSGDDGYNEELNNMFGDNCPTVASCATTVAIVVTVVLVAVVFWYIFGPIFKWLADKGSISNLKECLTRDWKMITGKVVRHV